MSEFHEPGRFEMSLTGLNRQAICQSTRGSFDHRSVLDRLRDADFQAGCGKQLHPRSPDQKCGGSVPLYRLPNSKRHEPNHADRLFGRFNGESAHLIIWGILNINIIEAQCLPTGSYLQSFD